MLLYCHLHIYHCQCGLHSIHAVDIDDDLAAGKKAPADAKKLRAADAKKAKEVETEKRRIGERCMCVIYTNIDHRHRAHTCIQSPPLNPVFDVCAQRNSQRTRRPNDRR